jgi:hypothetical protein
MMTSRKFFSSKFIYFWCKGGTFPKNSYEEGKLLDFIVKQMQTHITMYYM